MRHLLLLLCGLAALTPASAQTGRNVLVVVNTESADSVAIGRYYQAKREVPENNVVGIATTSEGFISRKRFDAEIRDPIIRHLHAHEAEDQILYILTTKGVPLVIEGDDGAMGDRASVDSELALLYRHMLFGEQPRFGRVDNPYFSIELDVGDRRPFRREQEEIYLVSRLTGTSAVDAVLLVDRGLDRSNTSGNFYFDLKAQQRSMVAGWLKESAESLRKDGRTVVLDESRNPLSDVAEASGFATLHGADEAVPQSMKWRAGGIALLMGAPLDLADETLRIIGEGATGVIATVGDTGRDGHLWPQIFFNAWLGGHNFAESAGLATRYLSWRNVVIGDPLARPFGSEEQDGSGAEFDAFLGSPTVFVDRRSSHLIERYGSSQAAIALLREAAVAEARGNLEEATTRCAASLDIDPSLPDTHFLLAGILSSQGDWQGAFDHFAQVLELARQDDEKLRRRLALIAVDELADPDAAEPHARWLFARHGLRDQEATRLWAQVNRLQGELGQAEALYYRLVRGSAEAPPFALVALAEMAIERGQSAAAREFLGQALESPLLEDRARVDQLLEGLDDTVELAIEAGVSTEPSRSGSAAAAAQSSDPERPTRPARIVHRVSPEYPKAAFEANEQGTVVLRLLIDERGQLVKTKVVIGSRRLVRAVEKTLPDWEFEPELIRGRPVVGWVTASVRFRIKKPDEPERANAK